MHLSVIVVGRPREPLSAAVAEYESRARRYWPVHVHEVREEPARGRSVEQVRQAEGERLLARLPGSALLVACDERGRRFTSEEFSRWLSERRDAAQDVAFIIGGAFGLSDEVRERASLLVTLAPWTLPHEMARLVLAEQLYRAGTLVRGEPYHK